MLLYGKQFKLMLSEDANKLTNAYRLPDGCPLTVRKIITDLLKFMLEHLKEYVEDSCGLQLDDTPTEFCLTVPAGWTEDVKQLYKEAASDAGLGCGLPGDKSRAVDVVMEPECAALCAVLNDKNRVDQLRAGQVFMVLDAGGGTVDMTVHEVQERPEGLVLSEKVMSRCILQGATRLDERMENHLKKGLVRDEVVYADWKAKNFDEFRKIMDEWELVKKQFAMDRRQRDLTVKLPHSFMQVGAQLKVKVSLWLPKPLISYLVEWLACAVICSYTSKPHYI
jgi:molecular chaperone DnaK (HSP70)